MGGVFCKRSQTKAMSNSMTEIKNQRSWFTKGNHDRGNLILKCVSFDQDCFHDIRKVCADVRQTEWKFEYVPELSDLPSDKYMSVNEGKWLTDSDKRELLKEIGSMNGVDHEVLQKLSVNDVVLLGSTQDGLYLEKGFQVFDKGVTSVNASDVDILYIYGGINVIKESIGNENGLWLTPRETDFPGYFKMQIMAKSFEKHEPFYLKNTHVKMKLLFELGTCQHYVVASSLIDVFNSASIVGCMEDEHGIIYIDNVAALRMYEWPDIAHKFTNRDRQHAWPAQALIEHVTSRGCGFVAKGHNESEDFEYQWRISFAESEKILSRSLNPAQIRAYLFLKTLFKTHLEDKDDPEGLSSYMMKTILFWTIESVDGRIWTDENMLNCVEILLDRLAMSLDRGVISSFFAPTLNLIGNLDREKKSILANKVRSLTRDLFSSIVTCVENPTFNGMCNTGTPLQQMYKLQDPTEFGALLSMIHFTSYLYLRLQVLMYLQKISVSALNCALEQACRSVCSVIAPRAVWYLLESIKLQPNTSLFSIRKDSDESYTLDVSGMRRHVVDFWRSANYSGLFTSVIKDQEIITGDAIDSIPEFDEFMEWVNTTCLWSGAHPVNRLTEKYPPNLD
ncbi:hypothetical protein DPMN_093267 [Dreissena polymorpha]|uniref:Mab-21-like HhH/H2TH-like domain-containing protein n=2 Tax=Dreissena polymorpha TaxID=45954 RepID=A0A9D4L3S1_DREPO|nr:hypothetical protein DPMN_093267 [Dreissena polymorpha]